VTPASGKPRGAQCGFKVRHAVAEALYPGYLARYLANAQKYVSCVLKQNGTRWVARIGWESAFSEALFGAMKGLVSWLLLDGPYNSAVPTIQTFIFRGIAYHFGKAVPWYVGPVRINVREYAAHPDKLRLVNLASEEDMDAEDMAEFSAEESGFAAVDDRDAIEIPCREILLTADQIDPSGNMREIIDMRHGITSGKAMTFEEIGRVYKIRKQAAHQRYQKAIRIIRQRLRDQC